MLKLLSRDWPRRALPCGGLRLPRRTSLSPAMSGYVQRPRLWSPSWMTTWCLNVAGSTTWSIRLEQSGADVAIGPVRPRFEGECPAWDPAGPASRACLPDRSGAAIVAGGARQGSTGFGVSTASSIWRRATCFTDPEPFNPEYGISGGEDFDMFLRLQSRGRRFVWCAEAGVWESIPNSRTELRYQAMRECTGAQVYTGVDDPLLVRSVVSRGGHHGARGGPGRDRRGRHARRRADAAAAGWRTASAGWYGTCSARPAESGS